MRRVLQRYEVYIDGTHHPRSRRTLIVDDRRNQTLVVRETGKPDLANLSAVEVVSEERSNKVHKATWIGEAADGSEVTVTGIRQGCGCRG